MFLWRSALAWPTLMLVLVLAAAALAEPEPEPRRGRGRGRERERSNTVRNGHHRDTNRAGKIFSLFSIVNFNNVGCTSTSALTQGQSNFRNGTCYTTTECSDRGGSAEGSCAAGFGVCCVFILDGTGSVTVSQNCTYLQNPNFPSTQANNTATTYTVQRCSSAVCSLRLDFETFTLRSTTGTTVTGIEGECQDTFVVTASGTNQAIPELCGENSGQHLYVEIGSGVANTATLALTFSDTTTARAWDIKVTQVECSNPSRPDGTCLQYHEGLTGRIETFNFGDANDNHLASQDYSVCIRAEAGFCCIQYQVCPDQTGAAAGQPGYSLDPNIGPMNDDSCRTTDYVGIDGSAEVCVSQASTTTPTLTSRYCGTFLNAGKVAQNSIICDCTQPFSVGIFTNANPDQGAGIANAIPSHGVCLEFMQIPC